MEKRLCGTLEELEVLIASMPRVSVHPYTNAGCVKCNAVKKDMARVGTLIFCCRCWVDEFGMTDIDPVANQREKYDLWLGHFQP